MSNFKESEVLRMSYEVFKTKVRAIVRKAGGRISVGFHNDREKGRYFANCSDGTTIIGNSSSLKVSVRWGNGHAGVAEI